MNSLQNTRAKERRSNRMCTRGGAWSLQNTATNNSSSSGLPVPPFGWPLPPSILRQNALLQQITDGEDQPLNLSLKTEDESSEKSALGICLRFEMSLKTPFQIVQRPPPALDKRRRRRARR